MSETKGEGIQGKLEYIGSTSIVLIEAKGSRRISIATVLTEGIDIDTNCKYPVDFQANAECFVECCNEHDTFKAKANCCDELVGICKQIEKSDFNYYVWRAINARARAALAKYKEIEKCQQ